jgi:hypothetical protein
MIFPIGSDKDIIFSRYQSQRFQKWYIFEDKKSITFGIVKKWFCKNPVTFHSFGKAMSVTPSLPDRGGSPRGTSP